MATVEQDEHVCDPERRLDYEVFHLRSEIGQLQPEIDSYLSSPQGRFELWCAEHERRLADDGTG